MISVGNKDFSVELDNAGSVRSFAFDGTAFRATGKTDLFRMRMRGLTGIPFEVSAAEFRSIKTRMAANGREGEIEFRDSPDFAGLRLTVALRVDEEKDASFWNIRYDAIPEDLLLEWIDFPRIALDFPLKGNGGDGLCFLPIYEGGIYEQLQIRKNSKLAPDMLEYPLKGKNGYYPGPCAMQFMALYTEEAGLYLAVHDVSGTPKGIDLFPESGNVVRTMFQHFCGEHGMGYEVCIAGFHGDWHAAAERYREFLQRNPVELPPRLAENKSIPEWLADSPIVLIYPVRGTGRDAGNLAGNEYFPYLNALPVIRKYHALWDTRIMALLMHWEGTAPWAPPYLWPPFGGVEALKDFSDALHENGDVLGLYGSGIGWTQQSSILPQYNRERQFAEEHLEKEMCLGPRREMYSCVCNGRQGQSQRFGYELCPSREFTRRTVLNELEQIQEADVDYLQYFDQNQGASAPFCYSREHGHFPMPEKWLTNAMSDLLAAAHATALSQPRRTIIGCENAAAEPYLRYLPFSDLRNHLVWRAGGTPIPAYNFIFHEYVNNFTGNGVCLADWIDTEKTPEFLQFLIASGFVYGDVVSLTLRDGGNFHWSWNCDWSLPAPDTERAALLAGNLNRWRKPGGHAHNALVFGRMETPPRVECETWDVHFAFDRPPEKLPSVLSSAWSHNGKGFLVLANIHAAKQRARIVFPKATSGKHFVSARDSCPTGFDTAILDIEIPPLEGGVIEYQS